MNNHPASTNAAPVPAWISIGSNVNREYSIRGAIHALRNQFGAVHCSPIYETAAEGFIGEPFLNLVAGIQTALPVHAMITQLRAIEDAGGRIRGGAKFAPRTLDLDLLTYGDAVGVIDGYQLPRDEIVRYAFVLAPLAAIAPTALHPALNRSYAELWAAFTPPVELRHYPLSLD
ncbi:2-amino-4-hydroxy-6-hydroxymethyldihydropteridine diphosphokinase [Thiospirillum jenense]|uniref:2-amino-4-hydroxy-6-hydroxymethyldihydropteridine diphosphokinase n=1 Tax=Thiospirillum jenense TaxID=1653858 RepID=A0A839HDI5_9GAMM|nr:2-amino-4-hydroxy-6-hydroxymethyldihydropteridine diphosphokinase [Thiospirillum jenense]MBB1125079.1 2-amino-4-hydroxy-6-hydroxymethyldihydropteridine diphosphokinase [Thiospirillum jenense]